MNETEKWYNSRAVWGGIVVLIAAVAQAAGYTVNAETQGQIVDYILSGVTGIGGLLAIWGRVKAEKRIE